MVHRLRFALPALLILAVLALAVTRPWGGESHHTAAACREHEAEHEHEAEADRTSANPMYAGPKAAESPCGDHPGHPESFADLAAANSARASRSVAPGTRLKPGAFRAAVAQRAELPSIGGAWSAVRHHAARRRPDRVRHVQRLHAARASPTSSGRVTSFAADPSGDHIFAAASNGGVWMSTEPRRLVDLDRRRPARRRSSPASRGRRPTAAR